ncbi:MAG: hypothetical protein M0Z66_08360 [Thermaerobacter sp.]|nr:hypothetical protein [Thermaerobacter sp.]
MSANLLVPASRMDRTARLVSLVGSPPILGTLYFLWLAYEDGPLAYDAVSISWALMLCLPTLFLLAAVHRGSIASSEMTELAERRRFLPVALLFAAATLSTAMVLQFPLPVQISVVGMALWVFLGAILSQFWKVSLHVSGTVGVFWLSVAFFGLPALWLVWLPPAVAWSRLRLHRHDAWQVAGGALLGTVCAFAAFYAFLR